MSVDLHGTRADNPGANFKGTSLSVSWWDWRAVAVYCFEIAPGVCNGSHHVAKWQSNDGCMTAAEADLLAAVLQTEIDSGRAKRYAQEYIRALERLPDVPCNLCGGTGKRAPFRLFSARQPRLPKTESIECNGCDGYGARRPDQCSYSFDVKVLQQLATFLKHCNGFVVT
jgi:hypothetical protein